MVEALKRAGTRAYVKIGTSGTGGMGFNIPYTHSEERPSRTLLTKSAVAGAHSLLLFLLGRTPGAPVTVEIKPTATIDRKSTRLNSSHLVISYAVFCLKKKNNTKKYHHIL